MESPVKKKPSSLVSMLMNDAKFRDADICAGGRQFPVHRNVVSGLSDFFMKAFSGTFKDAEKRSLHIEDASSQEMFVIVDFAYCQDVGIAMSANFELACEVILLSHRFEINDLTDIAATVACSKVTIDNCVRLFLNLNLYDCSQKHTVFLFIIRRLRKVSRSADFADISIKDLTDLVSSPEVVISEIGLHRAIQKWLKGNKSFVGSSAIARTFSHEYYELFAPGDDYSAKHVTSRVWKVAIQRSIDARFASTFPGTWDGGILVPSATKSSQTTYHSFMKCANFILSIVSCTSFRAHRCARVAQYRPC